MSESEAAWAIVAGLRAEVAAYRRAKAENDERYMIERDEARAAIPELEAVIEGLRAEVERLREALWARDVVHPAGPAEPAP